MNNGASSDRKAIAATFAATAVGLFAALVLGVVVMSKGAGVRSELAVLDQRIQGLRVVTSGMPVDNELAQLKERNVLLQREWEQLRVLTDTFQGKSPLTDVLSVDEEDRIDFKIALFNARDRLQMLADDKGASLPSDLGVQEEISTSEDADSRLWHLATAMVLAERLMDLGITDVQQLEALAPVTHALLEQENAVAEEYPVLVTFRCPVEKLPSCVMMSAGNGRVFVLRHFVAEKVAERADSALLVTAVYASQVYRMREDGDEVLSGGDQDHDT